MRLSRAEAIARIREWAKTMHSVDPPLIDLLACWAIFADDALMQLQRLETQQETPIRDSARLVELCRALEDLIIRFRP